MTCNNPWSGSQCQFATPNPTAGSWALHLRCFAPWEDFGHGLTRDRAYHGDNRSYGTSPSQTSRIFVECHYAIVPGVVTHPAGAQYDPSYGPSFPVGYGFKDIRTGTPTGNATVTERTAEHVSVEVTLAGNNPLLPSPAINVSARLRFPRVTRLSTQTDVLVGLDVRGDAYPACECFIRDYRGVTALLGGFTPRFGGARRMGPFVALPGNNRRPMAQTQTRLRVDAAGGLLSIQSGSDQLSPQSWNSGADSRW